MLTKAYKVLSSRGKASEYVKGRLMAIEKENEKKEEALNLVQKECVLCKVTKHITEYAPRRKVCKGCANAKEREQRRQENVGKRLRKKRPEEDQDLYRKMTSMKW